MRHTIPILSAMTERQKNNFAGKLCGPTDKGCMECVGARTPRGYVRVGIGSKTNHSEQRAYAHRVAWELEHGPIPCGMVVMHDCDNPPCCNVAHMRLGTQADNLADMRSKGRHWDGRRVTAAKISGMNHPLRKLTPRAVAEAREAAARGVKQRDLASKYGVSQATIGSAIRGDTWGSIKETGNV